MPTLTINTGRLSSIVDRLLFPADEAVDLDFLRGLAAAINTIGVLASGGVTPIGPPKKRALSKGPVAQKDGYALTGGVTPIGPPRPSLSGYVDAMIRRGRVTVPRRYPDLSTWVERGIPAHLKQTSLVVAGAQCQSIAGWIGGELAGQFEAAANRLFEAAL